MKHGRICGISAGWMVSNSRNIKEMIIKKATTTLIVCLAVMLLLVVGVYHLTSWVFWLPLKAAQYANG